jgi:hypothetical protein
MMGVGMPQALHLEAFGNLLYAAFGHIPYHVGSSMPSENKSGWRDVDVRLMLPDDEYEAMGLGHPDHGHSNAKWVALCMAFSSLGKEMTGLPIDFQIQQTSHANKAFGTHPRSALIRQFRRGSSLT